MGVAVNEARRDDMPLRVEFAPRAACDIADRGYATILDATLAR